MIYPLLKLLGSDYSIGVVTYVKRFDTYFKPLVKQLENYFPNVEKNYVLNGHYDQIAQEKYLNEAKELLKKTTAKNVVAYKENQCLSRCWNQLILHSKARKVLILNDDITIRALFRPCLESQIWLYATFTINRSWSHFVISKDVIKKVGWFEERFPANGMEDADYALRMALAFGYKIMPKLHHNNIFCFGLTNIVAKNEDPGWKKYSASIDNKFASVNAEFLEKKWQKSKLLTPNSVYAFNEAYFSLSPNMETPQFYDFKFLDNPLKSPLK